jgi:hypothetical protein
VGPRIVDAHLDEVSARATHISMMPEAASRQEANCRSVFVGPLRIGKLCG